MEQKYEGSVGGWCSWRPVLIRRTWKMSSDKKSIETLKVHCHIYVSCVCTERERKEREYDVFSQAGTLMGREWFGGIAGQK